MARVRLNGDACAGVVISDRIVASARHCAIECPCFLRNETDWTKCQAICYIHLREFNDLVSDTETKHVIQSVKFPRNSGSHFRNETDFMLFILAESVNSCSADEQDRCWKIEPAKIADSDTVIRQGAEVRTLGWGATELSFTQIDQSKFPMEVKLKVDSSNLYKFKIETEVGPNGEDTCKGDSGGPLILLDSNFEQVVVATLQGGGLANCLFFDAEDQNIPTGVWNKISRVDQCYNMRAHL